MQEKNNLNKKEILKVYAWKDEETGEVGADWDFPNKVSSFLMQGILSTIIHDLNLHIDENAKRDKDEIL